VTLPVATLSHSLRHTPVALVTRPSTKHNGFMSVSSDVLHKLHQRADAPAGESIDSAVFLAWCASGDLDGPPGVSRFLHAVWRERTDLTEMFSGVPYNEDARRSFLLWAHHFIVVETGAPEVLQPAAPEGLSDISPYRAEGPPPSLRAGVVVLGYLRAVLGLGDAARRLVGLCALAGERVRSIPYDHTLSPLGVAWPAPSGTDNDALDVVIVVVNGSETRRAIGALGERATQGRYIIGLWFWELDELSDEMADGLACIDELWVTSEFTAEAIRKRTDKPISVIPLGADVTSRRRVRSTEVRARFAIPEAAVVVGNQFDYWSRIERKNPLGLIEAWKQAFPEERPEMRVLFLKSLNGDRSPDQRQLVEAAIDTRTDILCFDGQLSVGERDELADQFDVVASLHRSEGYGLTLLDAMCRGVPVIATGYSGNLAFMTENNSWLVPYSMEPIPHSVGAYPAGSRWAAPDIAVAAGHLHSLVSGLTASDVTKRTDQAQQDVSKLVDGELGIRFIQHRLKAIRAARSTQG
jgi:glycosyltransferase involved in cell wall biosynthesis